MNSLSAEQMLLGLLDRIVALDSDAATALEALGELYVVVELDRVGASRLVHLSQGRLYVDSADAIEPDARIRGSIGSLARLFLGNSAIEGIEDLAVTGDRGRLERFVAVLRRIDPDWEEPLSSVVGDVAAHHLARVGRGTGRWMRSALGTLVDDAGEQLVHEARLVPSRVEWTAYCRDVARLVEGLERLCARAAALDSAAGS